MIGVTKPLLLKVVGGSVVVLVLTVGIVYFAQRQPKETPISVAGPRVSGRNAVTGISIAISYAQPYRFRRRAQCVADQGTDSKGHHHSTPKAAHHHRYGHFHYLPTGAVFVKDPSDRQRQVEPSDVPAEGGDERLRTSWHDHLSAGRNVEVDQPGDRDSGRVQVVGRHRNGTRLDDEDHAVDPKSLLGACMSPARSSNV